jgi:hypothetical protein
MDRYTGVALDLSGRGRTAKDSDHWDVRCGQNLGGRGVAVFKFTDPDWLRTIAPARLSKLLTPWLGFLTQREILEPVTEKIDCGKLNALLMGSDAAVPKEMTQTIYYIYETSSIEDMEELLKVASILHLNIEHDPNSTPADIAIDVWALDRSVVEQRHAETLARRQKNFEYFGGALQRPQSFPEIPASKQLEIEAALNGWFEAHRRGRGCRVFVFRHKPLVWVLVRHGMPVKREASHREDGDAATEVYRPQQHDVLLYDEHSDEMGVYATTKGERDLYLRTIGRVLFGNEAYFPSSAKFTLRPLIADGASALNCGDIEGIDAIRLTEYRLFWGGKYKESEVHRATDIFAALDQRAAGGIRGGTPSAAIFKVKFSDAAKERSITIRMPASARYERPADSELVERWLRERGFLLRPEPGGDDEEPTAVLESA